MVTTAADLLGGAAGEIVITLPTRSWDEPLLVTVDGRTASVVAGERQGLELLLRLVRHYADAAPGPHVVATSAPER